MTKIICPTCTQNFHLAHQPLQKGQQMHCQQCDTDFVVANVHPVELKPVVLPREDKIKPASTGINCPACEQHIRLHTNLKAGQKVICKMCQAELTVIGLNPLELDLAPMRQTRLKPERKRQDDEWYQFDSGPDSRKKGNKSDGQKRTKRQHRYQDWDDE